MPSIWRANGSIPRSIGIAYSQLYYGQGYLLYLPEGYEANPKQTWPLIIFLHGSGDRGDNLFLLAKASPFMMIREKGPLPFIIVAPLLSTSQYYASFPENYMDGVLARSPGGLPGGSGLSPFRNEFLIHQQHEGPPRRIRCDRITAVHFDDER